MRRVEAATAENLIGEIMKLISGGAEETWERNIITGQP